MSREGRKEIEQPSRGASGTGPMAGREEVLRVLQLTDMHLYAEPEGRLLGQNTRQTFELVLALARRRFWPADRILLTGDLVHDESPAGYRYIEHVMAALATPCNGIPGNHDPSDLMAECLAGGVISLAPSVRCGPWNLVFLDSSIPGEEGGHLGSGQLDCLEDALASDPGAHALVCLHHQPVPVGSRWMDAMALDNPDEFFAILDRHDHVRGILWGHVHQEFTAHRNGVALFGSPSTCIQFLPGSEDFAIDPVTPGYRWLELFPDGRIATGVERIGAYPDPIDLAMAGY